MIPPVIRAAWVPLPLHEAFAIFTDEIGAWWPLDSHGVFGDRTAGVAFESDQLVERSDSGEESTWAEVQAWAPPDRFVLAWHPGRGPDDASEVEVSFIVEGSGTRVVVEHRGWERFGDHGEQRRRTYVGPHAWGSLLDRFGSLAERARSA